MKVSPETKAKTAIAAAIGLCVPVFWGVLELLFMHARLSPATQRVWATARWITCPLWNTSLSNTLPLASAAMYGLVAFGYLRIASWRRSQKA
jgi:hypothetical protein